MKLSSEGFERLYLDTDNCYCDDNIDDYVYKLEALSERDWKADDFENCVVLTLEEARTILRLMDLACEEIPILDNEYELINALEDRIVESIKVTPKLKRRKYTFVDEQVENGIRALFKTDESYEEAIDKMTVRESYCMDKDDVPFIGEIVIPQEHSVTGFCVVLPVKLKEV